MEEGKIKKGNFFFLVFLLAAAVVIGSTVGLISNMNYIVNQTEILKEKPTSSNSETEDELAEPAETETAQQPEQNAPVPSASVSQPTAPAANPDQVDIGADERQLLREMLYSLGMKETDDFNKFVMYFQVQNNLKATGSIDYETLNAIIEQSTMQEVSKSLREGRNS